MSPTHCAPRGRRMVESLAASGSLEVPLVLAEAPWRMPAEPNEPIEPVEAGLPRRMPLEPAAPWRPPSRTPAD